MSDQITTALVNAYHSNIAIKFQQMGSKLRPLVRVETQNAEFDYWDRITKTSAIERTTRHGDSPYVATPHDRRRNGMRDFEWGDYIDKQDRLRMLADPSSSYVTNAVYALGRKMDDIIVAAFDGTAYTGKTGSTSQAYDTNYDVAVDYVESGASANSNLTIGKLRRAKYLLDAAEIPDEDRFLAVAASQIQSLLRTTEITNADYNTVKALVAGNVDTFMGFKFVRISNDILPVATNIRSCFAFWRQAMLLGVGSDVTTRVTERPDKAFSTYIYASATFGATRMWEEGVIRIKCDETK